MSSDSSIHPLSHPGLPALAPWLTRDRRSVLQRGKWLTVEEHEVEIPAKSGGKPQTISDWTWISSPSFINAAAVTSKGQWILFYQPKYACSNSLRSHSLATVGGYIEPDEKPIEAAKRELLEETGYVSSNWIDLHSSVADANRGCGVGHLFLALDAEPSAENSATESDDLEDQRLLLLSTDEVEAALLNGDFKVQSWIATISMSLLHYKRIQKEKVKSNH